METLTDHRCRYCDKSFRKESSLAVHLCEPKRRYQEQNETGVQIGMHAYLRFYEITQGSAKFKTFDDFAKSPYYRAFVKFGRYCQDIRAINVPRFVEWIVRQNKKLDHWCRESIYSEYLVGYLRAENVNDALQRAIESATDWSEKTGNPFKDYLRYGNDNVLCHEIVMGRLSPWVVYNSESGQEFLSRINPEQLAMIWPIIDADVWQQRFHDYIADTAYAKEILEKAGW